MIAHTQVTRLWLRVLVVVGMTCLIVTPVASFQLGLLLSRKKLSLSAELTALTTDARSAEHSSATESETSTSSGTGNGVSGKKSSGSSSGRRQSLGSLPQAGPPASDPRAPPAPVAIKRSRSAGSLDAEDTGKLTRLGSASSEGEAEREGSMEIQPSTPRAPSGGEPRPPIPRRDLSVPDLSHMRNPHVQCLYRYYTGDASFPAPVQILYAGKASDCIQRLKQHHANIDDFFLIDRQFVGETDGTSALQTLTVEHRADPLDHDACLVKHAGTKLQVQVHLYSAPVEKEVLAEDEEQMIKKCVGDGGCRCNRAVMKKSVPANYVSPTFESLPVTVLRDTVNRFLYHGEPSQPPVPTTSAVTGSTTTPAVTTPPVTGGAREPSGK